VWGSTVWSFGGVGAGRYALIVELQGRMGDFGSGMVVVCGLVGLRGGCGCWWVGVGGGWCVWCGVVGVVGLL